MLRSLPLRNLQYCITILCCIVFQAVTTLHAQDKGWLQLRVHDGVTGLRLSDASVSYGRNKTQFPVMVNGEVTIALIDGPYTVTIQCPGYISRKVSSLEVLEGVHTPVDIYLTPVLPAARPDSGTEHKGSLDSNYAVKAGVSHRDAYRLYLQESSARLRAIQQADISESVDRDLSWIARRQGGGFVSTGIVPSMGEGFVMSGLGERYNQMMLNGVPVPAVGTAGRSFMLSTLPASSVEEVKQLASGDFSVPADYAGGTMDVRLRDIPISNFITVLGGMSLLQQRDQQEILRSPWSAARWVGVPGGFRSLPSGFPQTKSRFPLSDVNIQEKADLLGELPHGMESDAAQPAIDGTRFMVGIGRRYTGKTGITWGFTSHLLHQLTTQASRSSAAVGPNLKGNPFPFANSGQPLISAFAEDAVSLTSSSLSLVLGAGVAFRKNVIRLHVQAGSLLDETVTDRQRIYKPDEDTLASRARMYQASQLATISSQLSGQHAFGNSSSLVMDWQVGYTYMQPEKPDERHLLFRENPGSEDISLVTPFVIPVPDRNNVGNAALAANLNAIFPNSYRSWERTRDHHFVARAGLQFPFELWKRQHVLKGGVLMQTHYREHYTDRLMYWGGRQAPADQLLAAGQFFPGGVRVEEYYTKAISSSGFFQINDLQEDNFGNYTGSLNTGASYLQYSGYMLRNLALDLGLRAESSSQLVSSSEYNYFEAFRNYRLTTLNENATVSRFDMLPMVGLRFEPIAGAIIHARYFETVNRPQMQELAAYRYYDPATFTVYKGNPFLQSARVRNVTVGASWHGKTGAGLSFELFYRDIDQPIEPVVSRFAGMRGVFQITPQNMPGASVRGIKADIEMPFTRQSRNLWSFLSARAGGVLSTSSVDAGPLRSGLVPGISSHQLSGTPDYTAYGGLVIRHPGGFGFSAMYQAIGNRLIAVGSGDPVIEDGEDAVLTVPHYREKERSEINLQISYAFFRKRLVLVGGAENLLRTPFIIYQDLNGDGKMGEAIRFEPTTAGGRYISGQDNVVRRIDQTPRYYFRIMYTW